MKVNIEERSEKARSLFKEKGYNCAQAVALAYADLFDTPEETIAIISASFGGGMGRLREVCGAVSGMSIIAGLYLPKAANPANKEAKAANYSLIQEMAEKFRELNGSIICRELLGLCEMKSDPKPELRSAEYYKKRPCDELVAQASRIIGETLNSKN